MYGRGMWIIFVVIVLIGVITKEAHCLSHILYLPLYFNLGGPHPQGSE